MKSIGDLDLSSFWQDSDFARREYQDKTLTEETLAKVQAELGYALPTAYVDLCCNRNGGAPRNTRHAVPTPTSWADDHVAIASIKGIGFGKWSLCGGFGQRHLLTEWEYPPIGVYFGDCPSAGHDALCLDYRTLNADGEPCVVHVDQDYDFRVTHVAASFAEFLQGLKPADAFT